MTAGPLAGVRVVEFDAIGPVPLAAMILADFGCEIVRIGRAGRVPSPSADGPILGRGRRCITLDLKNAATTALPPGVHFTLIEAVADHICETLFLQDARVLRVMVKIVKLAIAEAGESIGVTLVRHRR